MDLSKQNTRFDPLLSSLIVIGNLHEKPISEQAAIYGLPVTKDGLTPELFVRAAEQVGFHAHIAKRPLRHISSLVLPVVLLLENDNACVLKAIHKDDSVDVIFPENPQDVRTLTWSELTESYSGYLIYVTVQHGIEHEEEQLHPRSGTSWFWGTLFHYKGVFAHVFVAAFLTNLFVLVSPIYIMNVYDRVIPHQATETLWILTIGAMIFFIFDFIARNIRSYLIDETGRKADIIIGAKLFHQLVTLRMRQKPASAGAFASYFTEFEILREFFTSATLAAMVDLPFLLLFLGVIWWIGGPIFLVPALAVPIIMLIAILFEIPTKKAVQRSLSGATDKSALLIETIDGLETLKTTNAEGIMQRRWEDSLAKQGRAALTSRMLSNMTLNLTSFIQQVVIVGVVVYGVFLINDKQLTMGGLVAISILSGRAMMISQFVALSARFSRSRNALQALNKIMELPSERPSNHQYLHRPQLKGNIQFEKVTFTYPRRHLPALENVSFKMNAGERIGIIGRVGSGKSSLLRLLVGLYAPNSGRITIDETDNTEIDPADLRNNIRYVSSDATLFYGSIKDNIRFGNPLADDDLILKASHLAGVDTFVNSSPLGYDMPVGEHGESLSSGQRQAVILARAFVSKPAVLCLDEPTAGFDLLTEQEFIRQLPEFLEDRGLILITHRQKMLSVVDRIIVMDGGKIIMDGPKAQILERLGAKQSAPDEGGK